MTLEKEDAHPNFQMFADDLVTRFLEEIENTRAAALFKEMPRADQITCFIASLFGALLMVGLKAELSKADFDKLHVMLDMTAKQVEVGRRLMRQR